MENVENHTGRWTKQIVTIGDTGAPTQPSSVGMASHLKQVRMEIRKNLPTEADFAGFDIEFYLNTIGGTLLRQTSVAVDRDDTKGGQLAYEHTESFDWRNYGEIIIGRARAFDDSNNPSAWVNSSNAVTLNEVQTIDVGQHAITNSQEMFNAGPTSHFPGGVTGHTHLGNVTITTAGGQVEINGSCNTENVADGSADFRLVILLGTSFGSDPMVGESIITLNDLNHRGTNVALATMTPAPGTYTFSLWMESNQDATIHRARLSTFEVKR